jgi:AcrR family transcriptional regulator
MPKVVDPQQRRAAVARSVFRVICRDGLENASLRNVADDAGLAIGSVRHYFANHSDMLVFAMQAMSDQVTERVQRHVETLVQDVPGDERWIAIEGLLGELLPLDEERWQESLVWLAFAMAARTRPELADRAREVHDGLRSAIGRVLTRAELSGALEDGLDVELETERLCALLDGLATDAALQPERMPPELIHRILRRHLTTLRRGQRPWPDSQERAAER